MQKNTIRKTNSNGHESAEYQVNKGKEWDQLKQNIYCRRKILKAHRGGGLRSIGK